MTYAGLAEGLNEEALKDLDYTLLARPSDPPTRSRGAGALMNLMAGQGTGRRSRR